MRRNTRKASVQFLRSHDVWKVATPLVQRAKRTLAAVAYLGRDGGELLPLKPGDTLVVDMSLGAVRQGVTDPREVQKFQKRGVHVASRADLHAKVILADQWLVAGSMNASRNSAEYLAEAALVTNDRRAVADARRTIARWASSPVLPLELEQALKEYRPPVFKAAKVERRRKRVKGSADTGPTLWIVGGLSAGDVPASETRQADESERESLHGRRLRKGTSRGRINSAFNSNFVDGVHPGDWVIAVVEGMVEAPARVMAKTSYPRGRGLRRHLVILEERDGVDEQSWAAFRRAAKRSADLILKSRRTRVLRGDAAESVLGCWSPKTWVPLKKFFGRT